MNARELPAPGGLRPRQSLRLALEGGVLRLPAGADVFGRGALLELDGLAETRGWRTPSVEATAPGVRFQQHFTSGASGAGLVNFSPVLATRERGTVVRLRARGFTLPPQVTLHLFDPLELHAARVLVIAPHPDDAEIACFGLYADNASWVVTLTAGERGMADLSGHGLDRDGAAQVLARLRVDDSLSIPVRAGVPREHCVNLVFPDGALEDLWRHAPQPLALLGHDDAARARLRRRNPAGQFSNAGGGTRWPALTEELRQILAACRPTHIACPHPLLDAHPDHVFAAIALEEALEAAPASLQPEPLMLMYVVHSAANLRYPFGARTSLLGPPPATMTRAWVIPFTRIRSTRRCVRASWPPSRPTTICRNWAGHGQHAAWRGACVKHFVPARSAPGPCGRAAIGRTSSTSSRLAIRSGDLCGGAQSGTAAGIRRRRSK